VLHETIVTVFDAGATAEEIAQQYASVDLASLARGPRCLGAASLGVRTETEPFYVVRVPIWLVDDFLALPSVEHGGDPLRSIDLRQHARPSGVAGGYAARVAALCHGFKTSISP
jgi:hypothetical protein